MENKDFPELDPAARPASPAEDQDAGSDQHEFIDFFADILPNQPVLEETDEVSPLDAEEAEVISEIQSAVEDIISADAAAHCEEVPAEQSPEDAAVEDNRTEQDPEAVSADAEVLLPEVSTQNPDAIAEAESSDEEEEPQLTPIPTFERPVRKGRPKRKKGEFLFGIPQIAVTGVWLAIILVTGITLGRMLWICASDVLAFNREDKVVTISIYESDTMDDIITKLHDAQLIRYPGLFKLYVSLAVDEGEIQPGIWDLNTLYDYHALVKMMSPSSSRTVVEDVLIPEGFSCRQIFALLEENRVCTAKDLAEYAASGELKDYWFLENIARGDQYCLEGFLFPDTYDFYKNSSPRDVLEKMLDNFEHRFTEEMRAQLDILNSNVTGGTFDIHDVVIVASLIEKETASNEESPKIASVIYNRLFRWGDTPAYLNIDASIIYALDGKTNLTTEDLKVDSPYNTYTHTGLTPGAIANPGLASLKAALNPESTSYYFYVLDPAAGTHKFSATLDEHNAFIASLE